MDFLQGLYLIALFLALFVSWVRHFGADPEAEALARELFLRFEADPQFDLGDLGDLGGFGGGGDFF